MFPTNLPNSCWFGVYVMQKKKRRKGSRSRLGVVALTSVHCVIRLAVTRRCCVLCICLLTVDFIEPNRSQCHLTYDPQHPALIHSLPPLTSSSFTPSFLSRNSAILCVTDFFNFIVPLEFIIAFVCNCAGWMLLRVLICISVLHWLNHRCSTLSVGHISSTGFLFYLAFLAASHFAAPNKKHWEMLFATNFLFF